jgi:hypothetical protein
MNAEQHEWYWRGYNDAKKEDKREFAGLTDEEALAIDCMSDKTWVLLFTRAIEAKLKEKNNE